MYQVAEFFVQKNAMFDEMKAGGGSAVAYAWFEFEKGYKGKE